jgi:hypothetical protein
MGSGISQSAQQELSAFNSFINNFSTNIRNQVSSTCQAGNTLRFTTGGGNGCEFFATGSNININQTSQATCSLTSENITTITMNIENDLQNQLEQYISQRQNVEQGWLATALSLGVEGASTSQEIANLIRNSINTNITDSCMNQLTTQNLAEIRLCGAFDQSTFNINQDATVTGITSCINKQIITSFTSNSILNNLFQRTEQAVSVRQAGVDSFAFYIALAIGLFIIFFLLIFLLLFSGSSNKNQ